MPASAPALSAEPTSLLDRLETSVVEVDRRGRLIAANAAAAALLGPEALAGSFLGLPLGDNLPAHGEVNSVSIEVGGRPVTLTTKASHDGWLVEMHEAEPTVSSADPDRRKLPPRPRSGDPGRLRAVHRAVPRDRPVLGAGRRLERVIAILGAQPFMAAMQP